jgi:two-component system KDP operon response regulator KdpE
MIRILVVDGEPQVLHVLRINLRARGYAVDTAGSGPTALRAARRAGPDLVVLDLPLRHTAGLTTIRELRGYSDVPILAISIATATSSKINALDAGADDYVTKPFDINELLARIRALTRRVAATTMEPAPLRLGRYAVDLNHRKVLTDDGSPVALTRMEWYVLQTLARSAGQLVTQQQVIAQIWGSKVTPAAIHCLRQHLAQLRRKLEDDPTRPRFLLTEVGVGYRLRPEPADRPTPAHRSITHVGRPSPQDDPRLLDAASAAPALER